jgi:hypothetical protein
MFVEIAFSRKSTSIQVGSRRVWQTCESISYHTKNLVAYRGCISLWAEYLLKHFRFHKSSAEEGMDGRDK